MAKKDEKLVTKKSANSGNLKRIDVDIRDYSDGPRVTDVRGVGDDRRYDVWNAAQRNVAYRTDGSPDIHPDFQREKLPRGIGLGTIIFHIFGISED